MTLHTLEGCEYSMDGVTWQDSPKFTGLTPSTEYSFYQRFAETEDANASAMSSAPKVTTDADTYGLTITLVVATKTKVDAVAPTPNTEGNSEYYTGSDGKFYKLNEDGRSYSVIEENSWFLPKVVVQKVEAVAPTYTATGNIEYYTGDDKKIYVFKDEKYVESDEDSVTLDMLKLTYIDPVEPTCETDGNIGYWYDEEADKYFKDDKGEEEIGETDTIIPALGHKYRATWKWAKDYSAATVTLNCVNDPDEEEIVLNAEITEERVESTCKAQGKITYTATASYNNVDYTYPKTVKLPLGRPQLRRTRVAVDRQE